MQKIIIKLLHGYRELISPFLGYRCRFIPNCSTYAEEALTQHGIWYGGWLTLRRLCKCHPLYRGKVYDPVPETIVKLENEERNYVR